MKRIVVIYRENYTSAIVLFTQLKREMAQEAELLRHNLGVNAYAHFNDNSKLYMFNYDDVAKDNYYYNADIVYLEEEISEDDFVKLNISGAVSRF